MRTIRADQVQIGDRLNVTPLAGRGGYHSVVGVRRGTWDDVLIDVEDGNLVAALPPLEPHETLEIE